MKPVLNNIYKIEYIESKALKNITVIPGRGVILNMWRNFQNLDTIGLSGVTIATKRINRNTIYTVTLQALLKKPFECGNSRLCYRLTTITGEKYLLGTERPPFPITTTSENFPSVITDKSGTTLTVEYNNTIGLLHILDV